MSDSNPQPQIVVNGSPTKVQLAATLRQLIGVVGMVLGLLGLAKEAGFLHLLTNSDEGLQAIAGVAGLIALVWGNIRTGIEAKKSKAMADQLPDSIATTK